MAEADRDERYTEILLQPLRVCMAYQPMFGHGKKGGLTLGEFQTMYRGDPFYNWIGLDSPLMYAAHKAAGGMTSTRASPRHPASLKGAFRHFFGTRDGPASASRPSRPAPIVALSES